MLLSRIIVYEKNKHIGFRDKVRLKWPLFILIMVDGMYKFVIFLVVNFNDVEEGI